jgi:hypothetical protein
MTSLTITIPLPPKEVRNNARVHWAKKAAAVKVCRTETRLIAVRAIASDGLQDAGVIENDKELWPERPVIVTRDANPRVELVITEEEE